MNENFSNQINKYKIKISKINLNYNKLKIESDDNKIFIIPVKKGSIQCKIFNQSNNEVNLNSLEENSLVTIIGFENKEKNIIIIKKIFVKNKYVLNYDSSEEYNDFY